MYYNTHQDHYYHQDIQPPGSLLSSGYTTWIHSENERMTFIYITFVHVITSVKHLIHIVFLLTTVGRVVCGRLTVRTPSFAGISRSAIVGFMSDSPTRIARNHTVTGIGRGGPTRASVRPRPLCWLCCHHPVCHVRC